MLRQPVRSLLGKAALPNSGAAEVPRRFMKMARCVEELCCPSEISYKQFRKFRILSIIGFIPVLGYSLILIPYEMEHNKHIQRPEWVPYSYMLIRHKAFPWGDGQKSYFHNPRKNRLPSGWDDG